MCDGYYASDVLTTPSQTSFRPTFSRHLQHRQSLHWAESKDSKSAEDRGYEWTSEELRCADTSERLGEPGIAIWFCNIADQCGARWRGIAVVTKVDQGRCKGNGTTFEKHDGLVTEFGGVDGP